MYSFREYEELKIKYGSYASWAIWNYKNPNDSSIIDQNIEQLHTRYILLGLNISRQISGKWANFHDNTHARKLKYSCNDSLLRGSYMTDLFKDLPEPTATNIQNILSDKIINENVETFRREMTDIKLNVRSQFIIFGDQAREYFDKYFGHDYKNKIISHKHYSARGTDKEWVTSFWHKLNIDQNYDLIIKKYNYNA